LPVDVVLNVQLNAVAIYFSNIVREASPTKLEMGKAIVSCC